MTEPIDWVWVVIVDITQGNGDFRCVAAFGDARTALLYAGLVNGASYCVPFTLAPSPELPKDGAVPDWAIEIEAEQRRRATG